MVVDDPPGDQRPVLAADVLDERAHLAGKVAEKAGADAHVPVAAVVEKLPVHGPRVRNGVRLEGDDEVELATGHRDLGVGVQQPRKQVRPGSSVPHDESRPDAWIVIGHRHRQIG